VGLPGRDYQHEGRALTEKFTGWAATIRRKRSRNFVWLAQVLNKSTRQLALGLPAFMPQLLRWSGRHQQTIQPKSALRTAGFLQAQRDALEPPPYRSPRNSNGTPIPDGTANSLIRQRSRCCRAWSLRQQLIKPFFASFVDAKKTSGRRESPRALLFFSNSLSGLQGNVGFPG